MKNFLKYWYKFADKKAYYDLKNIKNIKKTVETFQTKYENSINQIQKKIENQKTLSFLHSGHMGDLIYSLAVKKTA